MALDNRPKWILATAAAIAGMGIGGVVLASGGGDGNSVPDTIALRDAVPVATQTAEATALADAIEVRSGPVVRADDGSFTVASGSVQSADSTASLDSVHSAASVDSLNTTDSVGTVDSLNTSDSVNTTDSVNTADSLDTTDTVASAPSADSVDSVDTANSIDSADSI